MSRVAPGRPRARSYVDYAMAVPMYFVYRNGQYINALGMSWKDFMAGKLPALPGKSAVAAAVAWGYGSSCGWARAGAAREGQGSGVVLGRRR